MSDPAQNARVLETLRRSEAERDLLRALKGLR